VTGALGRLVESNPELAPAAAALGALARTLDALAELPDERATAPDGAACRERLRAGLPALAGERLLAGATLLDRARTIAGALAAAGLDGPATVAAALDACAHRVDLDQLAEIAVAAVWDAVPDVARVLDVDEHALIALLDYAARPALRRAASAIAPLLAELAGEARRSCPACGAPPLLAELRTADGVRLRVLRCGRCAAEWPFPRIGCPSCGERDHRRLGTLHAEGEAEFRRAEYCETCRHYLKSVAVLDPLAPAALLEIDLATAALDWAALDAGYERATG
jgi:FdhE protein